MEEVQTGKREGKVVSLKAIPRIIYYPTVKEKKMQPTKTDLLLAWMTLVKVMDYYGPDHVDEFHRQVLPDVLDLLDVLQKEES